MNNRFEEAKQRYAKIGVDVDRALDILSNKPISIHCWQGDDVGGFENKDAALSGGIQATGNYPGKARTPEELMADFDKAASLIPGKKRINLHAIYAVFDGEKADRDKLQPKHFARWLEWAKKMSHPTGIPLAEAHISETVAWIGYFSLIWCLLLRYNPSNCKQ